MFKGPKAILSSAIANALAEYFEVDANQIQSNLLGDANIVLHAVELKEQITYVPQNSAGNETIIRVTGCVEELPSPGRGVSANRRMRHRQQQRAG